MKEKAIDRYEDLKHDFRTSYIDSEQSVGMFHLNDLGPQFDESPLFALKVSLALATIEAELYPTLVASAKDTFKANKGHSSN